LLVIGTFNIKNNYKEYQSTKADEIIKWMLDNKIDILCMQEVFTKCKKDLVKNIKSTDYKIYGNYRYKLPIFTRINEAVSIITKEKVRLNKTYPLPFLPSGLKRVVTKLEIETTEFGTITIFNTHLDFMFDCVKKKQLKKIINLIRKEKNPVIVTGDFNLKTNHEPFKEFIKEMKKLGLKRVNVNEKTLKQSRYNRAIDHIFIPNEYKVVSLEVIKDLEISDHYPVLLKIKK
jgi:endonuclease/exonuclease/phosphatase family metal-dependent hydrolase